MKKRKNKKTALILVLILLISVGYAALASNLKINGSSKVNAAKWNVYWDNVVPTTGGNTTVTTPARIKAGTNSTEVEYAVTLNEPGDYYEFTVDAVNNGTIDAMIAANGIVNGVYSDSNYTQTATLPDAVSYTVTYADGKAIADKHLLAKKSGNTATRETYKVRIEYRNDDEINTDDLDENDQTFYFKFSVKYVQADNTATESHPSAITYVTRQNEGQITPLDVIKIGETEEFFVVSSNPEKTILISKYNLKVGLWGAEAISTTTTGYGLQSADANAYDNYGKVEFSSTNYWMSGGDLLSPYNQNDTIYADTYSFKYRNDENSRAHPYVYDNSYITAPDFNNDGFNTAGYSIAYYVEEYKDRLIEMGAPSTIKGRLLKYEEETSFYGIYNNQYYWTGSAYNSQSVSDVGSGESFLGGTACGRHQSSCGVRPVIEIPTSEIK